MFDRDEEVFTIWPKETSKNNSCHFGSKYVYMCIIYIYTHLEPYDDPYYLFEGKVLLLEG